MTRAITPKKIIVIGSGNAALCAALSALDQGAEVCILEKANPAEAGGNTRYTAGAMRFAYDGHADLLPLLSDKSDERLALTDFGAYPLHKFQQDLEYFNEGAPLNARQLTLTEQSLETVRWLAGHKVEFEPIYSRQAYQKDGRYIFWGGLTLAAKGEGEGLYLAELERFKALGGSIAFETQVLDLLTDEQGGICGVECISGGIRRIEYADAVILGCGGFEASAAKRAELMGKDWESARVRGTRHNLGDGLEMARKLGARTEGVADACHAVPMDAGMPEYGNLDLPYIERKHYRKICYFLGVMLNREGMRFVDEGQNFRNYTYAQFGRAILAQPGNIAWQIFDAKVDDLLYSEYRFHDVSCYTADTLEGLLAQLDGLESSSSALQTIHEYNAAINDQPFDPTILDGRQAVGLNPPRSNWANQIDTPPFKAFPVTCGITFTYMGLAIDDQARVLNQQNVPIDRLYACGEMVGGVFSGGYPGGSGLTSGAVFGRIAGAAAVSARA